MTYQLVDEFMPLGDGRFGIALVTVKVDKFKEVTQYTIVEGLLVGHRNVGFPYWSSITLIRQWLEQRLPDPIMLENGTLLEPEVIRSWLLDLDLYE